jgi:hypothetical protein
MATVEEKGPADGREDYTQDGTVDLRGRPISRSNTGGWRACSFIVGNYVYIYIYRAYIYMLAFTVFFSTLRDRSSLYIYILIVLLRCYIYIKSCFVCVNMYICRV